MLYNLSKCPSIQCSIPLFQNQATCESYVTPSTRKTNYKVSKQPIGQARHEETASWKRLDTVFLNNHLQKSFRLGGGFQSIEQNAVRRYQLNGVWATEASLCAWTWECRRSKVDFTYGSTSWSKNAKPQITDSLNFKYRCRTVIYSVVLKEPLGTPHLLDNLWVSEQMAKVSHTHASVWKTAGKIYL